MFEAITLFVASLFGSSQADGGAAVAAAQAATKTIAQSPQTPAEKTMPASTAETDLQGPLARADLDARNYPWMRDGVPAARVKWAEDPAIPAVAADLPGTEVEVYFGSWCSDSHDHLPTFLALLDLAKAHGARPKSLRLVALDRKKTHPGYVNRRNVEKLPTFVFLRDGREIGRITETPAVSIAADSAKILGGR